MVCRLQIVQSPIHKQTIKIEKLDSVMEASKHALNDLYISK